MRNFCFTCSKIKSCPSQEVLVSKPVVVPDSELQASVGDILDGEVVPADGLLPPRAGGPPADGCLLLPPAWLTRQQVAENKTMRWKTLKCSSYLKSSLASSP